MDSRTDDLCETLGSVRDIAQKAQELAARNEELEHFAQVVSHDLRSPLVIFAQYLKILEKGGMISPEGQFYVERMKEQIEILEVFISMTLALSKAGQPIGRREPVDMEQMIERLFEEAKPEGIGARLVVEGSLPEVKADRMKIAQVIRNLLTNAFNCRDEEKDGIVITVRCLEGPGGESVFSFEDNRIGMSPQTLKKIFNLGYSERKSGSETGGFGLFISSRIISAHGGTMRAESPGAGRGSTLIFSIPP